MILLKRAEHGRQPRMSGLDGREQGPIFTSMVPLERDTESVAVQQQVTCHFGGGNSGIHRLLGDSQRLAQSPMHAA